ncbi:MAG TPA: hypothetical protein VJP86_09860 [Vicinamibacterales bacterium]|jgi:hypothetical protein|nr:hypothetical protein [Vicinamibacterales bacterium]
MRKLFSPRTYASVAVVAGMLVGFASPAAAQFVPRSVGGSVFGEDYMIEGGFGFWSPNADMSISSESLGIKGDRIDFKRDLGLKDEATTTITGIFHPGKKHKLRYEYLPLKYDQEATITRDITFNGQKYTVGIPVTSAIDWRTHRFGYEYDFLKRNTWFAGVIVEAKYTDIAASLESPQVSRESAHAAAPVPEIGGAGRFYAMPNLAIGGEFVAFGLPSSLIENAEGHYFDLNLYGTYNFTNYIGAQVGYRRLDLGYVFEDDNGSFLLRGLYFGVVARY